MEILCYELGFGYRTLIANAESGVDEILVSRTRWTLCQKKCGEEKY
jgi:hypothetical protein